MTQNTGLVKAEMIDNLLAKAKETYQEGLYSISHQYGQAALLLEGQLRYQNFLAEMDAQDKDHREELRDLYPPF